MPVHTYSEYRGYIINMSAHEHGDGKWAGSYVVTKVGIPVPPGAVAISGLHDSDESALKNAERLGKISADKHIEDHGE